MGSAREHMDSESDLALSKIYIKKELYDAIAQEATKRALTVDEVALQRLLVVRGRRKKRQ